MEIQEADFSKGRKPEYMRAIVNDSDSVMNDLPERQKNPRRPKGVINFLLQNEQY